MLFGKNHVCINQSILFKCQQYRTHFVSDLNKSFRIPYDYFKHMYHKNASSIKKAGTISFNHLSKNSASWTLKKLLRSFLLLLVMLLPNHGSPVWCKAKWKMYWGSTLILTGDLIVSWQLWTAVIVVFCDRSENATISSESTCANLEVYSSAPIPCVRLLI